MQLVPLNKIEESESKGMRQDAVRIVRKFCWLPVITVDTKNLHWMECLWKIQIPDGGYTCSFFSKERFPASYSYLPHSTLMSQLKSIEIPHEVVQRETRFDSVTFLLSLLFISGAILGIMSLIALARGNPQSDPIAQYWWIFMAASGFVVLVFKSAINHTNHHSSYV